MSTRHTKAAKTRKTTGSKIAAMSAATLATAGVVAGGVAISQDAPSAEAVPGNSVVLGDSLTANPDLYNYFAGKGVPLPNPVLSGSGCGTDNRFSDGVGRGSGLPVDNYSCAGASYRTGGMHISDQARIAHDQGSLNGETKQVVLLAGTNDTYPYVLNDHLPVDQIEANLRNAIADTVREVKGYAPNADVKVIGMPHVVNSLGQVCPINLIPNVQVPSLTIQISDLEWALERAGQDGANAGGARFVSLKPVSDGHEMCSNDRWIVGLIDTTSGRRNLPVHMTDAGLAAVGLNLDHLRHHFSSLGFASSSDYMV